MRSVTILFVLMAVCGCDKTPVPKKRTSGNLTPKTEYIQSVKTLKPEDVPAVPSQTQVFIANAKIDYLEVETDGTTEKMNGPKDSKYLQVQLFIRNQSETKKVDYRGWGQLGAKAFLSDEFGNDYSNHTNLTSSPWLKVQPKFSGSIYPGKSARDTLLFEPPVDKATKLTLRLEREGYQKDGEGFVQFILRIDQISKAK